MNQNQYQIREITVFGTDIAQYVIVIPADTSASVRFAAEELQTYIRRACGTELPIVADGSAAANRIILDDSRFTDDESFSITQSGKDILIGGSRVRGVLYGVYEFLERYLGWRFLAVDTEVLTNAGVLAIDTVDYTWSPFLIHRDPHLRSVFDAGFSAKRKINAPHHRDFTEKHGGGLAFGGWLVHTMEEHAGCLQSEQPCLSDETTYQKVLKSVRRLLSENPGTKYFALSQNDNPNACQCAKCKATDEEEGSPAGTMLRFVNRIAEDLEADYPDVSIVTLAYQYTEPAPRITKPHKNVIIQLCLSALCVNHPMTDLSCRENDRYRKLLDDWNAVCDRVYIWNYTTPFYSMLMPYANLRVLRDNMRYLYEHNVKGILEQGEYLDVGNGEFGALRGYIHCKLLEHPLMTEEAYKTHINEFLQGYYGAGWLYIRKYIDFIHEIMPREYHFQWWQPFAMLVPELNEYACHADEIELWFSLAEEMAQNDLEVKHIRQTKCSFTYMKLIAMWDDVMAGTDEDKKEALLSENKALRDSLIELPIRLGETEDIITAENQRIDATKSPLTWSVYPGPDKRITLLSSDIRHFSIVYKQGASDTVMQAIEKLQYHINYTCSRMLPIVTEEDCYTSHRIVLDETEYANGAAFRLCDCDGDLMICGDVMAGVYAFLSQYIGWQFPDDGTPVLFAPDHIVIDRID